MPLSAINMRITLATVFLLLGVQNIVLAEPPCHLVEIGPCVDHIVNYVNSLPRRTLPSTESDMKVLCDAVQSTMECLDSYEKRCMSPLQTEIEKFITQGARAYNKEFCAPGSRQIQTYLKNAECLNKQLAREEIDDIINRAETLFEGLDEISILQMVRYACCGWNTIFGSLKQMGVDNCGPEAGESVDELLAAVVSTLPSMICGSFEPTSDRCTEVLPPKGAKPAGKHNPIVDALRKLFSAHMPK